ncbi:hypothetical protein K458DRAFT_119680 [Lentithecium fluviatile CBS 122367]|uniref:Uncharacterized protein n=1 Tax=Lentithecium fluviatile CBS 122367 TaxID=1168545 RepID=A0A6G1ILE2_9PLEO|nr:hypothetical protein K458DRAFT_119680 [Lentithecium fluviatile CBS 122367]
MVVVLLSAANQAVWSSPKSKAASRGCAPPMNRTQGDDMAAIQRAQPSPRRLYIFADAPVRAAKYTYNTSHKSRAHCGFFACT